MEALLEEGCIIVATSNRAPWDLNRHGLHEDLFGHFVQNLLQACKPYQLSAEQDYRRLLVKGPPPPQAKQKHDCDNDGLCQLPASC